MSAAQAAVAYEGTERESSREDGFFSDTFYPTPPRLIRLMLKMVEGDPTHVLEPSAGDGAIIEELEKCYRHRMDISAIEINPTLQDTLRGKGIKVLDSDFLAFSGTDKFDLIIANPPFNKGAEHLLKAIDIMFRGQIVFLLNAETLKNPCTNTRKLLAQRLDELKAEIEFHHGAFRTAERKTDVEVALVHIDIERDIEDDLFAGVEDAPEPEAPDIEEMHELSTGRDVEELVAEYNEVVKAGTTVILDFYRHHRKLGKYLALKIEDGGKDRYYPGSDLTSRVQGAINQLLVTVRHAYWRRALDLKEVRRYLTEKKQDEFEHTLNKRCDMDFTVSNIRQFVLNLMGGFEKTLTEAVLDIFDKFTRHGYMDQSIYEQNIHYFNGWKTNSAFKVGKRVIIPIYGSYGGAFYNVDLGRWKLDYRAARRLRDIDIVMSYFDGLGGFYSISDALKASFDRGESKTESSYFKVIAYKKGTIHLEFKDMDILRRFNLAACKGKGWLPDDYGAREYKSLGHEERAVVDSFEGEKSYSENRHQPLYGAPLPPMLEHQKDATEGLPLFEVR